MLLEGKQAVRRAGNAPGKRGQRIDDNQTVAVKDIARHQCLINRVGSRAEECKNLSGNFDDITVKRAFEAVFANDRFRFPYCLGKTLCHHAVDIRKAHFLGVVAEIISTARVITAAIHRHRCLVSLKIRLLLLLDKDGRNERNQQKEQKYGIYRKHESGICRKLHDVENHHRTG